MSIFNAVFNHELLEDYQCDANMTYSTFKRPILGSYFLIFGVLLILLYISCLMVMLEVKTSSPTIKIMRTLAVFDILSLSVNSLITGILDIIGATFCHHPIFIFFFGAIGTASWMAGCLACILLVIDQCVQIHAKFLLSFLVSHSHIDCVIAFLNGFWIYVCLFTQPGIFTAEFSFWFFVPEVGQDPNLYLYNVTHTINNFFFSALTTFLCIYLCFLYKENTSTGSMWVCRAKQQKITQALVICSFHAVAAYIYVYIQFFNPPPLVVITGQLARQWSNGCSCVVYLTLDRTTRNTVFRKMLHKRIIEWLGLHVDNEETTAESGGVAHISTNMVNVM